MHVNYKRMVQKEKYAEGFDVIFEIIILPDLPRLYMYFLELCSRIFKILATNLLLQTALAIIYSQYFQNGILARSSVTIFALICPKVEQNHRYKVPSVYYL